MDHILNAATEPVGKLFISPADISWGPDSLVQPDIFVVPLEEARTLAWPTIRTLMLAVEVLSPSSVRADRFTKRRLYQEVGVAVYWVIDADAGTAEIWTPLDRCRAWRVSASCGWRLGLRDPSNSRSRSC